MTGETIEFADMGDASVTITKELGEPLHLKVHLQFLTYSNCLINLISKGLPSS